jgi:hypothetical protein
MRKFITVLALTFFLAGCATTLTCAEEAKMWKQEYNECLVKIVNATEQQDSEGAHAWLKLSQGVVDYGSEMVQKRCEAQRR